MRAVRTKKRLRAAPLPSFASTTKRDICTHSPGVTGRAELCGMAMSSASVIPRNEGGYSVRCTTESLGVARRMMRIAKELGIPPKASVATSTLAKNTYIVTAQDGASFLSALDLDPVSLKKGSLPKEYLVKEADRAAVLRGAFLAAGSVSNPKKNYHAEIVTTSEGFCRQLQTTLSSFGIRANIFSRKGHFVLYLNEGDSIVALLALIGAHTSILNLENVRILKETRNNVNRAVNCETANISKTVDAAVTQIRSIRRIERELGLDHLSSGLREAAQLRLDNPDATLQELCELSGTSKSCMNHRLRKINEIARALSEEGST